MHRAHADCPIPIAVLDRRAQILDLDLDLLTCGKRPKSLTLDVRDVNPDSAGRSFRRREDAPTLLAPPLFDGCAAHERECGTCVRRFRQSLLVGTRGAWALNRVPFWLNTLNFTALFRGNSAGYTTTSRGPRRDPAPYPVGQPGVPSRAALGRSVRRDPFNRLGRP